MNEVTPAQAPAPRPRRRGIFIGLGVALAGLACICVVGAVIFAVLDPFGWIGRLLGGGTGAAAVTPPDAPFYLGVDLARLRSEDVDRLLLTFAEASDSDVRGLDSAIEKLDEMLDDELGLTITEDVLPWVGQYAGFTALDLGFAQYGGIDQADSEWLLAVEARDRAGADSFLERLRDALEENTGGRFEESEYEGVTLYDLEDGGVDEWAMARSGSYVLIGPRAETLSAAIDAQRGESLADTDAYQASSRRLPRDAVFTSFVDFAAFADLAQSVNQDFAMFPSPYTGLQSGGVSSMGFSGSLVDEGIRFNGAVLYDPDAMTETQLESFGEAIEPVAIDRRFPAETFLFVGTRGLSEGWTDFEETLAEDEALADFAESLRLIEDQIGIDLGDDLFAYLDGEIGFGLAPASEGALPEMLDLPLGMLVLAETTAEDPLRQTLEDISDQIPEDPSLTVREATVDGIEAFELADSFQGTTALVYGVHEGMLFIASGEDLVQAAYADGASLADDETYRDTWAAFPAGQTPTVYLDLEGLLGQIRESQAGMMLDSFDESTAFLDPIRVIAGAASMSRDYAADSTIIVFIEWSVSTP